MTNTNVLTHDSQHTVTSRKAARRSTRRFKVPGRTNALLTQTSKMPGPSWSIPAHRACPRANGTICGDCYASKGCYGFSTTQNAQEARFTWTRDAMRTPEGRGAWTRTMVDSIRGEDYFRVHDSGDMFNVMYAECWYQICLALPETKFWIPTRAWQQPSGPLPVFDPLLNVLRKLATLPNVAVRPSALDFGDAPPVVAGLHAGTTSEYVQCHQCPAPLQNDECGDCRHCWNHKTEPTSYARH